MKIHDDVRLTTHMVRCKMMKLRGWYGAHESNLIMLAIHSKEDS